MRGNGKRASGPITLELLELRRLLSTVNVLDFGAVPDDGRDDSGAIRDAVNSSSAGDTIYFPAGTYDIGKTIRLKGDRDYKATDGAELQGSPDYHIFEIHEDNVRVEGFTFDGKPIFIDKPNGQMVANVVINDNTFHVHARGHEYNGISFTTGLRNSSITNNTFDPMDADNGIYGYNWDNLTIANNEFRIGNEGIHLTDFGHSSDLLIEQNYLSGLRRMGVEIQGGGTNTIVQDNYYENPVMSSDFHKNDSTFAFSIIADQSSGSIVRRNTAIATARPDGVGVRIVFEVGGDNTLVEDNYSVGSNHVLAANDGVGTTSVLARNNRWSGYLQGPNGRGLDIQNNGADVNLSWNVNRGKPGRNKRLGLDGPVTDDDSEPTPSAPEPKPDPKPEPRPVPEVANKEIYLSDVKWKSARNGWGPVERDRANGNKRARDGKAITINGKTYEKGLGTAVNSEIVYNLNGQYSHFLTDIGVDDQAGKKGSVTFQVWADGVKIYDSGVMRGRDSHKSVDLDLDGVKKLRLVTTNAGDGGSNDHADWAGARLLALDPAAVE